MQDCHQGKYPPLDGVLSHGGKEASRLLTKLLSIEAFLVKKFNPTLGGNIK